jgi:hypothetical protein
MSWRLGVLPEATGIIQSEFQNPAADRLVGSDDALLQQHFLD